MSRRSARRLTAAALAAVGLTGLLVACGDGADDGIDYLVDARISSYNVNTVDGAASGAVMALSRVLPGFSLVGSDGQIMMDRDLGSVTVEDGSALTVRYQFSEHAVYSDGAPMVCDDLLLAATAMGGHVKGFAPATTAGYRDIASVDCTPGEQSATVTFRRGRDYTAWRALFGPGALLPAHVIGKLAGVPDVAAAINDGDRAKLAKIADAWNTGLTLAPGDEIDPEVFVASGPYRIDGYTVENGLQLVANDKWWGQPPATDRVRVWGRGTDTEAAVADGRIDVVDTADLALADRVMGRAADTSAEGRNRAAAKDPVPLSVTQLTFADRGVVADARVRKAFAACVPRDDLARRYGANGVVWSLRTVAPADPLGGAMNALYSRRYPRADVARSRELLAERGENARPVTVRIGYTAPDPVAEAVVAAIAESCGTAKLTVTDAGSGNVTPEALGSTVDVLLTNGPTSSAAAGTASGLPDLYQLFGGDPLNLAGYRNPQVTGAINDLAVTVSDSARLPLLRTVETAAWDAMVSLPLYGTVRARENTTRISRVVPGLAYTGTGWNMDRWVHAD